MKLPKRVKLTPFVRDLSAIMAGVGRRLLPQEQQETYDKISEYVSARTHIKIPMDCEDYLVVYTRELVNSELPQEEIKATVDWLLATYDLGRVKKTLICFILAEYLDEHSDPDASMFYSFGVQFRGRDLNAAGALALHTRYLPSYLPEPFSHILKKQYVVEDAEHLLTAWGQENIELVLEQVPVVTAELSSRGKIYDDIVHRPYLQNFRWGRIAQSVQDLCTLGRRPDHILGQIRVKLILLAEDYARASAGLTKINDFGSAEELICLEEIRSTFPYCIIHHKFRTYWLGRGHLDILIEDAFLAVNFHEAGNAALCAEKGIELITLTDNYDIDSLIRKIRERKEAIPAFSRRRVGMFN